MVDAVHADEYDPPRIESSEAIDVPLVAAASGNADSSPSAAFRSI